MKKLFVFLFLSFSVSSFAATTFKDSIADIQRQALSTSCGIVKMTDPNFCGTYQSISICNCIAHTGVPGLCTNARQILNRIIATIGLSTACSPKYQTDVPQQECIDDANFYLAHC